MAGESATMGGERTETEMVKRHGVLTRVWHWVNAVTLLVLLMSGLSIFNAHPRLYWGESGNYEEPAWFAIGSSPTQGYVRVGETRIPSTGVLGNWRDGDGNVQQWAFPGWATIPSTYSLAAGRRWHFFFAWIFAVGLLVFMTGSLVSGHIRRQLAMRREEWKLRHIGRDIVDHLRWRFPSGRAALTYNTVQKLSYISLIFIALPLMILTGLAMSPDMDAALGITHLFGGRQSARSIHFICAFALVGFTMVHLALVVLVHPLNQLRAMTIGKIRVEKDA